MQFICRFLYPRFCRRQLTLPAVLFLNLYAAAPGAAIIRCLKNRETGLHAAHPAPQSSDA